MSDLPDLNPAEWSEWLTRRGRRTLDLPEFRPAAVLVGLTREPDSRLLLTVRSQHLPTHQGQISFPGGRLEAGEGPIEAALREAWEEVGLDPAAVQVLGLMDDVFTPVGFHVTPVLATLPGEPALSLSGEVSEVLWPRLSELRALRPTVERRALPPDFPVGLEAVIGARPGDEIPLYRYPWAGHDIWGMTARIIHDLLPGPTGPA